MANPRLFTIWAMSYALLALIVPNALGQQPFSSQEKVSERPSSENRRLHPGVGTAIRMFGQPAWLNRVEIGCRLLGGYIVVEYTPSAHRLQQLGLKKETSLSFLLNVVVEGSALESGCPINIYSSDPNERMEQLIFQSEDYRQMRNEWRRFWFTDQPSDLTYERIHGGIGP